eukprot:255518_1
MSQPSTNSQWKCINCNSLQSCDNNECKSCKNTQYPKCVLGRDPASTKCIQCGNKFAENDMIWQFNSKNDCRCNFCHEEITRKERLKTYIRHDLSNCLYFKRFMVLMNEYSNNEHRLMTSIHIKRILDDYLHLITTHHSSYEFALIVNNLCDCDISHCQCIIRNTRNRDDSVVENEQKINAQDIALQDIMDKIHCFYHHSIDTGHRLTFQQNQKISNFETEISNNMHKLDDLSGYLVDKAFHKIKKMLELNRKKYKLMNNNSVNRRNHNYKYISNQLFPDIDVKESKENINATDSWSIYHSGKQFLYGYDTEHKISGISDYDRLTEKNIEFDNSKAIIVSPKYADLKEELTNNGIKCLGITQYNVEYQKALYHFSTQHRQKQYNNMNVENILSLLVYCNCDGLQNEFSKTYRSDNGMLHNNFFHMGKNLKMSVHSRNKTGPNCGCCGEQRVYYHGISQILTFPLYGMENYDANVYSRRAGIHIHGPLSTSACRDVAMNFADISGLIVQFKDNNSKHRRFSPDPMNVSWLSDYPHEQEHLYIQNMFKLQIFSILEVQTGTDHTFLLAALNIISGGFDSYAPPKFIDAIIQDRLSGKFAKYKPFTQLSEYGRKICDVYFNQTKQISLAKLQWSHLGFWNVQKKFDEWVNLGLLMVVFPNLEKVTVHVQNITCMVFDDIQSLFTKCDKPIKICIKSYGSNSLQFLKKYYLSFGKINCFVYNTGQFEPISRISNGYFNIFVERCSLDTFVLFLIDCMDIIVYNDVNNISSLIKGLLERKISNVATTHNQQKQFNQHTDCKLEIVINHAKLKSDSLFSGLQMFLTAQKYCLDIKKIQIVFPNLQRLKITDVDCSKDVLEYYSQHLTNHRKLCEIVLLERSYYPSNIEFVQRNSFKQIKNKYKKLVYNNPERTGYGTIVCIENKENQPHHFLNSLAPHRWGISDCGPSPVPSYI